MLLDSTMLTSIFHASLLVLAIIQPVSGMTSSSAVTMTTANTTTAANVSAATDKKTDAVTTSVGITSNSFTAILTTPKVSMCYNDTVKNTTCISPTGICYVTYIISSRSTILSCMQPQPPTASGPGGNSVRRPPPTDMNGTMAPGQTLPPTRPPLTGSGPPQSSMSPSPIPNGPTAMPQLGGCVEDFNGQSASGQCVYCCHGNLCTRAKPLAWFANDCMSMQKSPASAVVMTTNAFTMTLAAAVVVMVMIMPVRL